VTRRAVRSRRREVIYGGLWIAGTAVPLSRFIPWLAEHGFDPRHFFKELVANRISAFFAWDVFLSAGTILTLVAIDRELPIRQRLAVAASTLVGASSGLPLYLLLRERHRPGPIHEEGH
jgi:hypothetical protein